jgi:hypothetical protein
MHGIPPILQELGLLPTTVFHFRTRNLKKGKIRKWAITSRGKIPDNPDATLRLPGFYTHFTML